MATKTAPKKSNPAKHLSFQSLLSRLKREDFFPEKLRTAHESGWFVSDYLLSRLTAAEYEKINEAYKKNKEAKKASPGALDLPTAMGSMVAADSMKQTKTAVTVTGFDGKEVTIDKSIFLTMLKKYPKALMHLTPNGDGVIFSAEKKIVGVIYDLNREIEKEKHPEEEAVKEASKEVATPTAAE